MRKSVLNLSTGFSVIKKIHVTLTTRSGFETDFHTILNIAREKICVTV
jgi:hypothetical protein